MDETENAAEPTASIPVRDRKRPAPRWSSVPWLTCAILFLVGAACAFAAAPFHGFVRGLFIGASIALIAAGGLIIGIRVAQRADAIAERRGRAWLPSRDEPR